MALHSDEAMASTPRGDDCRIMCDKLVCMKIRNSRSGLMGGGLKGAMAAAIAGGLAKSGGLFTSLGSLTRKMLPRLVGGSSKTIRTMLCMISGSRRSPIRSRQNTRTLIYHFQP